MIAVDTNVLVRFLVEDDPRQSARARALVSRAAREGTQIFVSGIVVCEVVWVLDSAYGFEREEIVGVLHRLLQTRQLAFHAADRITRALEAYRSERGDFADYLIRAEAIDAGCEAVVTFDKALLGKPGFRGV